MVGAPLLYKVIKKAIEKGSSPTFSELFKEFEKQMDFDEEETLETYSYSEAVIEDTWDDNHEALDFDPYATTDIDFEDYETDEFVIERKIPAGSLRSRSLVFNQNSVKDAMVLSEIFQKPKSLRRP